MSHCDEPGRQSLPVSFFVGGLSPPDSPTCIAVVLQSHAQKGQAITILFYYMYFVASPTAAENTSSAPVPKASTSRAARSDVNDELASMAGTSDITGTHHYACNGPVTCAKFALIRIGPWGLFFWFQSRAVAVSTAIFFPKP